MHVWFDSFLTNVLLVLLGVVIGNTRAVFIGKFFYPWINVSTSNWLNLLLVLDIVLSVEGGVILTLGGLKN